MTGCHNWEFPENSISWINMNIKYQMRETSIDCWCKHNHIRIFIILVSQFGAACIWRCKIMKAKAELRSFQWMRGTPRCSSPMRKWDWSCKFGGSTRATLPLDSLLWYLLNLWVHYGEDLVKVFLKYKQMLGKWVGMSSEIFYFYADRCPVNAAHLLAQCTVDLVWWVHARIPE